MTWSSNQRAPIEVSSLRLQNRLWYEMLVFKVVHSYISLEPFWLFAVLYGCTCLSAFVTVHCSRRVGFLAVPISCEKVFCNIFRGASNIVVWVYSQQWTTFLMFGSMSVWRESCNRRRICGLCHVSVWRVFVLRTLLWAAPKIEAHIWRGS